MEETIARWRLQCSAVGFCIHLIFSLASCQPAPAPPVQLQILANHVVMSNGWVTLTLSSPDGLVTGVEYNRIVNLLNNVNKEDRRGHWDVVGDTLVGTSFKVIQQNDDLLEVSFYKTWKDGALPFNVDKRFIMLRGHSGLYTYSIFEHSKEMPAASIGELRIVFKLDQNLFHYMAISDNKQRFMSTDEDRSRGQTLEYAEVDDKYEYSSNNKDNNLHGWISDINPMIGFWMITPTNEFKIGGPLKQDLTSHVGPTVLSMFSSSHYAGPDLDIKFSNGEEWKKVFGPVFIYLNSGAEKIYNLARSQSTGDNNQRVAAYANVGLAPLGDEGSFQYENKGYQFWTVSDASGNFMIKNVNPGTYNLFAWFTGAIGEFRHDALITIVAGSNIRLNNLVYKPPRASPTLWEIGVADRTPAEFFIPDPDPSFVNPLYKTSEKFRQYGLWSRYGELYPKQDLVYTVGISDWKKDWFYAHVNRKVGNGVYQATTWHVIFDIEAVNVAANYTLFLALASANEADIEVRMNNQTNTPTFRTGFIGKDNAIARHGIHGLYRWYRVIIPGNQIYTGRNTIFLMQSRALTPFFGVMYDYLRLDGPP